MVKWQGGLVLKCQNEYIHTNLGIPMHLYRAGMPLVLLSEFLGHADINTTRIYAWADTEMKRQAIQKVSKVTEGDTIEPIWANDEEMIKRLYGLA